MRRETRAALAGGLFGRQVVRRAQHLPGHGQFRIALQPPGQAEVHHVRLVLRVNQDVGGLQVAMQDAALMGVVDRLGDGLEITGRAPGRQRLVAHQPRQALPLDVVHHEEVPALVDAHLVDGDDVRMVQTRRRNGLGAEPLDQVRTGARPEGHHLDRDHAVQAALPGAIDHAHAAAADLLQQFVVAKGKLGRGRPRTFRRFVLRQLILRR